MSEAMVRVWDPIVRVGHWLVVIGFAIAYFTEDDLLTLHVWAGYVVGAVVALRIVWGFIGPQHARFTDFVRGPKAVLSYLADLLRFRAERHLGHSPAGGAMAVVLLLCLAGTVVTGLMTYGADKKAGPLAPYYAAEPLSTPAVGAAMAKEGREAGDEEESTTKELHELLANVTLILVILHVAGVALASIVHRENLFAAMITGRKRAGDAPAGERRRQPLPTR